MKTYNETHEFTRRNPSYLTAKERLRDAKIARKIIYAHDVEGDNDKMVEIFFTKCHLLSNPRYWEIMRTVWCAAGNAGNVERFRSLMRSTRPAKSWFMTPEDKETLDSLDYPITLWRAYKEETDKGISWSRNLKWVKEYADSRGLQIKNRLFNKDEIFAYISRRGEDEFIIL